MDFEFAREEREFREEVHRFLDRAVVTKKAAEEEESGAGVGPYTRELWKKLGERGWICPHWPKEYGGLELPHVYKYLVEEELSYFGVISNLIAAGIAGPVILQYGSDDQKREFLPQIAKGEIEFALGYTEPQAGSDLSSIEIRAKDEGRYFVLNGQKMFNTRAHCAEYHWLLARTEATTPKHKGLTLFIVDMQTPGITVRPLWVMGGAKGTAHRTNEVFYDEVRVPKQCMVGEKNRGFYLLMEALAYERIYPVAEFERRLKKLVAHFRETGRDRDSIVRQRLAELWIDVEVLKLLSMKICWLLERKTVPHIEAALSKTLASQFLEKLANLAVDTLGPYGLLHRDSEWAVMDGEAEWLYRDFLRHRITRGTPEIMWNIVAHRGLGLPRA